ncbi:MAG: phytoene/squalene synthase family protein [Planctomycetota bacterium]|jgi:phytoene synthase
MSSTVWTEPEWQLRDATVRAKALKTNEAGARKLIVGHGRDVLKQYSTSFFVVTRFLPQPKRAQVNMVYASVRFPDEVVDTFPLTANRRVKKLEGWRSQYEHAIGCGSIKEALVDGVPSILAGYAQVMRETSIPAEYYHSFLDAMLSDVRPQEYETLPDLIENYVYGSAVVVGYFLTHIYGATDFERAMEISRRLGIALQLTNFIRDVSEDHGRGRLYLPVDMLRQRGVKDRNFDSITSQAALCEVVAELARRAATDYQFALDNIDSFKSDCHVAIESCIRVYSELNARIASSLSIHKRESVPLKKKLGVLPTSKYWRLPLAYLGLETA